ncbi:MAG: hypothetical protein HQL51_15645, partial [Magnetococcales bacterium]|nr:hypothetical protein [Magnetococcales bacterium]
MTSSAADRLRAAGFSDDDINAYIDEKTPKLRAAGYSDDDVFRYFRGDAAPFDPQPGVQAIEEEAAKRRTAVMARGWLDSPEPPAPPASRLLSTQPPAEDALNLRAPVIDPNAPREQMWGEIPGAPKTLRGDASARELAAAAYQASPIGMISTGKAPEMVLAEDAPASARLIHGAAALMFDAPVMAMGGGVGAAGGEALGTLGKNVVTMGGGFGLPAAVRKVLTDAYAGRSVFDGQEFVARLADQFTGALVEGGKGWLTGAAAAVGGPLARGAVGAVARAERLTLPAAAPAPDALAVTARQRITQEGTALFGEIAGMTFAASGLEGRLPTAHDFTDAAVLLGGWKVGAGVARKLHAIYARTGKLPREVLEDIQQDRSIKEDVLRPDRDIPRAYQALDEA